ncbi:MAG: peptidylprolyl isomerase, partial [Pseudomonadota bacterium]
SSKIEVTPEEIQQFLRSPDGQARLGVLYRIGHILIALPKAPTTEQILATQAKAEKIVTDIKNGATVKEESTLYSQSKNALQGGDLGWRTTAQLPPMFLPFVVKMKLGDVSAPIRNASGFHIITLMDKKNASNTQAIRLNALYIPFTGHTPTEVSEFQSLSQKLAVGDANWADLTKKFPLKGHASVADWVEVDALPPEVQKRLDTLSDRSISEPIASSSGWYIIQVVERKSAPSQTEQATRWIAARKFEEALELWQRHARLEAHIIYHE